MRTLVVGVVLPPLLLQLIIRHLCTISLLVEGVWVAGVTTFSRMYGNRKTRRHANTLEDPEIREMHTYEA